MSGLCQVLPVSGPGQPVGDISDLQLVVPSLEYVQKEPSCTAKPAFTSNGPEGGLAKVSKLPVILLHLQAFY